VPGGDEVKRAGVTAWKYSPDQPRVPKGDPDGGQWTIMAGNEWGVLIAELGSTGTRRCVYEFHGYAMVIAGPTNFGCQTIVHESAVSHGQYLNDNEPG
jgi:hypothetical protein